MNRFLNIIVFFFFLTSLGAQNNVNIKNAQISEDSVSNKNITTVDSVSPKLLSKNEFKPDPVKVVWMGAIIPGYGQIMNKKYWKLPIVYGGFLGCAYALAMNSTRYQTYKTAYRDILQYQSDLYFKSIIDKDQSKASFIQIIPRGYTIESFGGISGYTNILKTGQDGYRRYRDLSIIVSIGYYALTLVDAYVDAQLYDFDISPDLSLRFQPTLLQNTNGLKNALGMQCSFTLK